jgi:predicted small metal-binding protein
MNTIIKKLNEEICKEYTIEVTCDQSHIIDSYEEGELEEVSFIESFHNCNKTSSVDSIGENLKTIVNHVLETHTQFKSFEEYMKDNFNYSDDYFIVNRQVNKDQEEPSKKEVDLWKIGEEDLYSQYTHIKVKVNKTLIDVNMINDIISINI